jgi:hypothetical protein
MRRWPLMKPYTSSSPVKSKVATGALARYVNG